MPHQQESTGESAARAGRFVKSQTKGNGNAVKKLQDFAKAEAERKRKEEEEKRKKKAAPVNTAPQEGFLTRMYKKYMAPSEKK